VDGRDRLLLVGRPVRLAHAHASQAKGGDPQALAAERPLLHGRSSRSSRQQGYRGRGPAAEGGTLQARGLGAEFRKLWTANAISNLGDGVTLVAAPLLAASLTRDPLLVAGLFVAHRLPWLLFSLVSGALVDRLDRRLLMASVDLVRFLLLGLLGVVVVMDAATVPLLYAVLFALGTAETLFDNAAVSILPAVVPKDGLPRANARLLGARVVAEELAAPPLAGLLFAAAAAVPFLLDAGSFAVAAALIAAMRGRFRVERVGEAPPTTLRSEIAEGVRWLWRNRLLRILALALGLMNLTLMATGSILVLFAQERLGLGPVGYGTLLSSMAVGGIAASMVAERVVGRLGAATTMRVGLLVETSTHLVLALSRSPLAVGVIFALFGFHAVTWSVTSVSLRQELVPARLLGRVNSAYAVFSYGGLSLGALVGGLLARRFGLTAPFWCSFVAMTLLILAAWPILSTGTVRVAREQAAP
jgi:Na+/melibiose symporter-like transporter